MEEPYYRAALDDPRPLEERPDFSFFEVVAGAAPVQWKKKKAPTGSKLNMDLGTKTWRRFPEQFQKYTSSCVAQTLRKLGGISSYLDGKGYIDYSANSTYRRRANKPGEGMGGDDVWRIARTFGLNLEAHCESDGFTSDAEMEKAPEVIKEPLTKVAGSVVMPIGDIELIASTIQATEKGVMFWMFGNRPEWEYRLRVLGPADRWNCYFRHSVAVVDYTLDADGNKALVIEDSAFNQTAKRGQRLADTQFVKERNYYCAYPLNLVYAMTQEQPSVSKKFTKPLEFIPLDARGYISDLPKNEAQKADVIALQDMLKKTGDFPISIPSTGYYGGITAKAVYTWQVRNKIAPLSELDAITPRGGRFGPKSIAFANR